MSAEPTENVIAITPYMDDKGKINAPRLAAFLDRETPTATGGGLLYAYRNGCYQPAEEHIAHRVHEVAGDAWTRHLAGEVIGNLRAAAQPLDDEPPLDRINLANGIYDLNTRSLQDHTPEYRSPIQLAVHYDENAECPTIQQWLVDTLDDEVATLFVEIVGYLLTADNRMQRAIMFLGGSGGGKTTGLRIIEAMLGQANVSHVALQQLDEHRFAPAQLYGKLANIHADLPSRAVNGTSVFKCVTGNDPIMAEHKGRDPFTFRAYARFVFSANEVPPTHDGTEAYFDRWTILPFSKKFRGKNNEDRNLGAKLTTPAELSGLLNLALAAIHDLRHNGFTTGHAVTAEHERFRLDSDPVAAFLNERTTVDFLSDMRTSRRDLYSAYTDWAKDTGRRPLNAQRFTSRVREQHAGRIHETTVMGSRYWNGIKLNEGTP